MTDAEQQFAGEGQEISLNDIIDFFVTKWKIFFTGALAGLVVASGGTFLLGQYEAEATLINKSGIERQGIEGSADLFGERDEAQGARRAESETYHEDRRAFEHRATQRFARAANKSALPERSGIDYLTWQSLKRNLPMLAARMSETNAGEDGFLKALSSQKWWQMNVVPTFALTKEDAKSVSGISKELQEAESVKIKDFVVTAAGASKDEAQKNLSVATSFLRSGGAYLALRDVIAGYRIELLNAESGIAKEITESEIELVYLKDRLTGLESLKTKFPGHNASIIIQPMDPKGSSAKYLPIATQIIAAHKDIDTLKENLSRLHSRKNQLAVMESFLSQAMPVMDGNLDGLVAAAALMQIEAGMRKDLQSSDWNRVSALNSIKHDLVSIQTRFTLGLEQPTFFDTRRPGYLKSVVVGLAAGFFLALLFALGSVVWSRYRR